MTAGQGLTRALAQAEPLPLPSELIHAGAGFKIRRGQLVMVAGASGCGKSMFTMWLLHRIGVKTLYISADMDPFDATVRLAAMATGDTQDAIERAMVQGGMGYYESMLADSAMSFAFDSGPALEDIAGELDAYVEVNDAWPDVIVVDNLVNLQGSEEWQGQMFLLSELHTLARTTGSTVFVLHHAKETDKKDPTKPSSKKGVSGMVTQYPELVLTVALDQINELFNLACVKQRGGKADASGEGYITLAADPARCSYGTRRPTAVSDWWKDVE